MPRPTPASQSAWFGRFGQLLGRIPDGRIAKMAGVTATAIGNMRRRLGIPPAREVPQEYDWLPGTIRRLGSEPDQALAEEVGCTAAAVRYQRRIRGIPPFSDHQAGKTYEWTRDEDVMMGTMPDGALARFLGVSEGMVSIRRRALGIPSSTVPVDPEPVLPHLGKVSDVALAERFGISKQTILKWRKARRIPPFKAFDWSDWDPLLGTEYDAVIAERMGVSLPTVLNRRRKLGIPPKRWSTKPKKL